MSCDVCEVLVIVSIVIWSLKPLVRCTQTHSFDCVLGSRTSVISLKNTVVPLLLPFYKRGRRSSSQVRCKVEILRGGLNEPPAANRTKPLAKPCTYFHSCRAVKEKKNKQTTKRNVVFNESKPSLKSCFAHVSR